MQPSGAGNEQDPILIENCVHLKYLADQTNSDASYSLNKYFKQTANIDLSSYANWTPIGYNATYYFGGNYDGGGYKITGLNITSVVTYAGLFGYVKTNDYNVKN